MNSVQGKVWGETRSLFCKNNVEIHRIEVKAGGFCSKHKHEHKHNAFYVESGCLRITAWKNDYDLVDETTVRAGQLTTCPPKEYHSFHALEDTHIILLPFLHQDLILQLHVQEVDHLDQIHLYPTSALIQQVQDVDDPHHHHLIAVRFPPAERRRAADGEVAVRAPHRLDRAGARAPRLGL